MFLRMYLQVADERKFLSLKRSRLLPIYARFKSTVGRKTYETNISISPAIEEAPSKKPHRVLSVPFAKRSFESVHESPSRGTRRRSRGRAERRNKKSTETESVYIGIQWLRLNCGFSGRAKMEK